jgi:hypothetical protein
MAHPDLDRLLSFCLPFAQEMLKKRDEFYPFAATVLINGELNPLAINSGEEHPSAKKMIDELTGVLKHNSAKGELQAAAICYDGRVTVQSDEKKDAITVFLEHSNGESVTIYLPYSKKFLRGYQYEPIIGVEAERKIFV